MLSLFSLPSVHRSFQSVFLLSPWHVTPCVHHALPPATVVEGMFSLWVGYRCYDYASDSSRDSINAIAELPLCKGRSRVAEALCPEWIETTKTHIPGSFWKALAENKLQEERTWAAIQKFSINCEKRLAAERITRKVSSMREDEPVVLTKRVSSA